MYRSNLRSGRGVHDSARMVCPVVFIISIPCLDTTDDKRLRNLRKKLKEVTALKALPCKALHLVLLVATVMVSRVS